jgi:hypothetical protein
MKAAYTSRITSEAVADTAVETITSEAAHETGRSMRAVRRVLDLMLEAEGYGASLMIIRGRLSIVADGADLCVIPAWFRAEIDLHYDDCFELVGPIVRSMVRIERGTSLQ